MVNLTSIVKSVIAKQPEKPKTNSYAELIKAIEDLSTTCYRILAISIYAHIVDAKLIPKVFDYLIEELKGKIKKYEEVREKFKEATA